MQAWPLLFFCLVRWLSQTSQKHPIGLRNLLIGFSWNFEGMIRRCTEVQVMVGCKVGVDIEPAGPLCSRRCLKTRALGTTHERTNLSLLIQLEFFGLYLKILLNRTWATGAIPLVRVNLPALGFSSRSTHIGAPGWPEFDLNVASTYVKTMSSYSIKSSRRGRVWWLRRLLDLD